MVRLRRADLYLCAGDQRDPVRYRFSTMCQSLRPVRRIRQRQLQQRQQHLCTAVANPDRNGDPDPDVDPNPNAHANSHAVWLGRGVHPRRAVCLDVLCGRGLLQRPMFQPGSILQSARQCRVVPAGGVRSAGSLPSGPRRLDPTIGGAWRRELGLASASPAFLTPIVDRPPSPTQRRPG
jgi:hypothetical protein